MRNIYARYPDEATDNLIVAVIDAMSDWFSDKRNEPYCNTLRLIASIKQPDIARRYKRYRLQRFRDRHLASYSFQDYLAARYPPPPSSDLYQGALTGAFYALDLIVGGYSTVYHPEDRLYHFLAEPFVGWSRILRVVKERKAGRAQPHFTNIPPRFYNATIGTTVGQALYRLLVFIFRYLRNNGYNWQFRSDMLGIVKSAEDHGCRLADTFEEAYFKEVAEPPFMQVEAYFEAYGILPDGYPPRLDDYKDLSNY